MIKEAIMLILILILGFVVNVPDRTIYQNETGDAVYAVHDNVGYWVENPTTFKFWGYEWSDVFVVPGWLYSQIPQSNRTETEYHIMQERYFDDIKAYYEAI